jgi:hypothetical protein
MVIAFTVYLALLLLAALVIFPVLILGSRADREMDIAIQQLSERQLRQDFRSGDERERAAMI